MCNRFKRDIINRYLSECNQYKQQYEILDQFIRSHNLRCVDCEVLLYHNKYYMMDGRCNGCGLKTIANFWVDHKEKFIFVYNHSSYIFNLILMIIMITLLTYILIFTDLFNFTSVQLSSPAISTPITNSTVPSDWF